jgi:hypothetical protein
MSQEVAYRGLIMAINGVDYNKQLSKDREYFQETTKKLRDIAQKRIEDTEKRADHVMTKQRDNFIQDKAELEGNYQENINKLNENTAASLENKSAKYNEELKKERQSFASESTARRKDFDERINDIKSSYSKAFDSERNRHEDLEKTNYAKYGQNVSELIKERDEKLSDFQNRMAKEGTTLKDQYNLERMQLVDAQENRLSEAYENAAQKRAALKDQINWENKQIKDVHEDEIAQQKQYTSDRLSRMEKKFQDRYEGMTKEYSDRSDNIVKTQQDVAKQVNRNHQEYVTELKRDYNDNLRNMLLDKRRRENGSGEFAKVIDKQQGFKEKTFQQNQIKRLKEDMSDAQKRFELSSSKERKDYGNALHEQSVEAVVLRDKKLHQANADKIMTVTRERERATKDISNRINQNRLDKSAYETQLMNERAGAKERLTKLKENFNKSVTKLEENHSAVIQDVTKVSKNDKAEFVKKVEENRADEIFEIKRSFAKLMDATVHDYETRLASYQRDNEYLKMTMEHKIKNIIEQTENKLASQKKLYDEHKLADIRDQQIMMDQRENHLKRNFADMSASYQKKIDKMQLANDTKFKSMVNEYETRLKEEKALASKELASKITAHQIEYDRTKQIYEDEKARLVDAYESQIDSIKNGHAEAMKQLQEFKKLS